MFGLASIKVYGAIFALVAVAGSLGWVYVQNVEAERDKALKHVGMLKASIATERQAREDMEEHLAAVQKQLRDGRKRRAILEDDLQRIQGERDEAIDRLAASVIAKRLHENAPDLACRATRASLRVFDELAVASGGAARHRPDGMCGEGRAGDDSASGGREGETAAAPVRPAADPDPPDQDVPARVGAGQDAG